MIQIRNPSVPQLVRSLCACTLVARKFKYYSEFRRSRDDRSTTRAQQFFCKKPLRHRRAQERLESCRFEGSKAISHLTGPLFTEDEGGAVHRIPMLRPKRDEATPGILVPEHPKSRHPIGACSTKPPRFQRCGRCRRRRTRGRIQRIDVRIRVLPYILEPRVQRRQGKQVGTEFGQRPERIVPHQLG